MDKNSHFSNRTDWELHTNQITSLHKELLDSGIDIIDLTQSNPTRCGFNYPQQTITAALNSKENLIYSPDSKGLEQAREAIAHEYKLQGMSVDKDNIILTSSTSEAYAYLFRLLINTNEKVLFPSPSYPLFQYLGELNDVELDYYELKYNNGWHIDFADLIERLAPDVKGVVMVNPNNPTGSYVSEDENKYLNDICNDRNISLISDEVFFEFSMNEKNHLSFAMNQRNLTFTLGGLSKMMALPQMKVSWIIVNGPSNLVAEAISRLEIIADTFLSVSTPSQNALSLWFKDKESITSQVITRLRQNYSFLKKEAEQLKSIEVLKVEGGWYAILKVSSQKSEEEWVLKLLNKYHVFVHPGFFYDIEGGSYIVLSLIVEPQRFEEGIGRILSRIEQERH